MKIEDSYKEKKLLYITVKPTPYRTCFFNKLAEYCDLTVLYESNNPGTRNKEWSESEVLRHKAIFLNENCKSRVSEYFKMIKIILRKKWDAVIIGCWNLRIELCTMITLRMLKYPYTMNLDGEYFFQGNSFKQRLKRFLIRGAKSYVVAGEESAKSLRKVVGEKNIIVYYFSSLTDEEIIQKSLIRKQRKENLLVVGRNFYVKGMDVIVSIAKMSPTLQYKIVGMGVAGIEEFKKQYNLSDVKNIEFVPFLHKEELDYEYQTCKMLVLPSRQECWGLVVNEAAAFGTPIVSTEGSGDSVEFLSSTYPQFLAKPGDPKSLYSCIQELLSTKDIESYSNYLKEKSKNYSIAISVKAHLKVLEERI